MKNILGEIEYKTNGIIQIGENKKDGFTLWTLKIKENLKEQLNNNEDIKKGLTVSVAINEKNEIERLVYLKNM